MSSRFRDRLMAALVEMCPGDTVRVDAVLNMVDAEIEDERRDAYDDGHDDGEASVDTRPSTRWLDDIETGLRLIDSDREAAKVYLERSVKYAGAYLKEVAPCL